MDALPLILHGLGTVFDSLGRALICLGPDFRIVHGSGGLDRLAGPRAAEALAGKAAEEVFGPELFGPDGTLRRALTAGELREGWGAVLRLPGGRPRQVSLTVAPILPDVSGQCDPRVAYVVVLRPVQDGEETGDGAPTLFAGLIARSPAMLRIFALIRNLEESEATILLTGESGTGKELVARELENALEYAVAVCKGQTIHADDLPVEMLHLMTPAPAFEPLPLEPQAAPRSAASADQRQKLQAALSANHWRRDATAQALGISRTTLWRKMRDLDL